MIRARRRSAKPTRARRRLLLELLEDRTLLDVGVSALAAPALAEDPSRYDPTHVLLRLRAGAVLTPAEASAATDLGGGLWQISLEKYTTVSDALALYRSDPRVDFAQPDYKIQVQLTPNDPYLTGGKLWGLTQISAPAAWNTTTGSSSLIVGVIDTGIDYTHPDLLANLWHNPGESFSNGRDNDADGIVNDYYGANFVDPAHPTGNVWDDNGHGTHVAGIIGAVGNNGVGVVGVNWHVQLMALKFLDASGSGYTSGAVEAIDYALAHGARVLNASWGGGGFDQALSDALTRAKNAGVLFVAAAGNAGQNNDSTPNYPSNYAQDNVIAVAASDQTGHPAWFTNYGATTVDLYAPGVNIWSTWPGGGFKALSGTSMATPFVTGAVALLEAAHPTWTYSQVVSALRNSVDHSAVFGNVAWGGQLDVAAALAFSNGPPAVTGAAFSGPASGAINKVRITFNEAIDPTTFTIADDLTLTGPGGAITVTGLSAVAGSNNTQWDVTFATQTAVGGYQLTVGPRIKDLAGTQMAAANRVSYTIFSSSTFSSGTVALPIRDFQTTASSIKIGQDLPVAAVTVHVDITHTWDGDLVIQLKAPDGTLVTLFNRRGGSGHNIQATFDDQAATPIQNGTAPFAGTFRPEKPLSAFAGKNAKGTWQLLVSDHAAGDIGTLNSWSLTITPSTNGVGITSNGHVSKHSLADGGTAAPGSAAGDAVFAAPWLGGPLASSAQQQASSGWLPGGASSTDATGEHQGAAAVMALGAPAVDAAFAGSAASHQADWSASGDAGTDADAGWGADALTSDELAAV